MYPAALKSDEVLLILLLLPVNVVVQKFEVASCEDRPMHFSVVLALDEAEDHEQ